MNPIEVTEAKHALAGLAEILRSYFLELRGQGFSKRESLLLVRDYQSIIARGPSE